MNALIVVYAVIYRGGFAVTDRLDFLIWLMEHNNKLEIQEFSSYWDAWQWSSHKYVDEKLKREQNLNVLVPTIGQIMQMPYHELGFVEIVPAKRYFAIASRNYVGIYETIQGAVEFMNEIHPTMLKEFQSESEARFWLNYVFLRHILPMRGYLTGEVPYIKDMPLDKAVAVNFIDWTLQNCQLPRELYASQTTQTTPLLPESNQQIVPDPMNAWLAEPNSDK